MVFQKLLKDPKAISEFDRSVYSAAYNSKDAIRASNAWYQACPQDIEDSKTYHKLSMPVIGIGGSGYEMLAMSLSSATTDLQLKKVEESGYRGFLSREE